KNYDFRRASEENVMQRDAFAFDHAQRIVRAPRIVCVQPPPLSELRIAVSNDADEHGCAAQPRQARSLKQPVRDLRNACGVSKTTASSATPTARHWSHAAARSIGCACHASIRAPSLRPCLETRGTGLGSFAPKTVKRGSFGAIARARPSSKLALRQRWGQRRSSILCHRPPTTLSMRSFAWCAATAASSKWQRQSFSDWITAVSFRGYSGRRKAYLPSRALMQSDCTRQSSSTTGT